MPLAPLGENIETDKFKGYIEDKESELWISKFLDIPA
jgi:hypothetical protein